MKPGLGRYLLAAGAVILAHFMAGWLSPGFPVLVTAIFWVPTGVAVAAVVLLGPEAALYVAIATVLWRLSAGRQAAAALMPGLGSALEALLAYGVLRAGEFDRRLIRLRDVLVLTMAAAAAPLVSASLAGLMYLDTHNSLAGSSSAIWSWWRMNALGIMVATPPLLLWLAGPQPRPSRRTVLEVAAGALALVVFLQVTVLGARDAEVGMVLSYLSLAGVFYYAVRFGPRGAATAALFVTLLAVFGTAWGKGPFVIASVGTRELALQTFVLVVTLAPLMLGALTVERERAFAARDRSDLTLRAFQDLLPDISYRLNVAGTYLDMYVPSGIPARIPAEQIVGRRLEDIVPEHAATFRALIAEAAGGGMPAPFEYEMRRGDRRWVVEARFLRSAPGEVVCLARDITERKRAEQLLGWQAQVLELVATGRPTIEVLDTVARGIEALSVGGLCSVLLLEGRRVHVASAPTLPPEYNAAIEGVEIGPRAGSCGTAAYYNRTVVVTDIAVDPLWQDYRAAALPHGLRACWSVPIRSARGEVLGTFAVYYREPRSPAHAELALVERAATLAGIAIERERREDLLASVNRNVAEGLFRSTPDRGLVYVNRAFATMFGYDSPEQMLQVPSAMLYVDPARREELKRVIADQGAVVNEEVRFVRRDGSTFFALVSSAAVHDRQGAIQYYDGAIWDITERKQLEEQLRQAQKMEAVGKLAGGVAHDFNNLLTAIGGYAEALLGTLPPGSQEHQDAEEITRAAARAAGLTRQLLAYSRQQVLSPQVLDLRVVVDQLGGMLRRLIGEDIRLVTRHGPEPATVRVDRGQIEQVILNLVLNARDAMPQGGVVTVATASVSLDASFARGHVGVTPGPHVRLTVEDTGIGMDAEIQSRAFDPFFTTKELGKGTGLGLSTVVGIVQQSGGTVWLESAPGSGTTARVYLPWVEAGPAEEEEQPERPSPQPARGTVLVVEDEQVVRDLVARSLRRAGYTVLTAEHGEEALAVSRSTRIPIDLVVTDVVMPRMGGPELARHLLLERPGVRVLFVSGYTSEALDLRAELDHGTEYLQKPFTPAVLLERVRRLLAAERVRP